MAPDTSFDGEVLTIPCMVNRHTDGPGDSSTSGVLFVSSAENLKYFVLSVYTPTEITHKKFLLFDQNLSSVNVFFIGGERTFCVSAAPVVAWSCEEFGFLLREVFQPKHHWSFASDDCSYETGEKLTNEEALSWFIIYQVTPREMKVNLAQLESQPSSICSSLDLRAGMAVTTRSYPFGPDVMEIFTDTRSLGIISNITESSNGTLFLTDARCLPGSEGGGIYVTPSWNRLNYLVGMIVTPLCRKTRELIGFTVCCSMIDIIHSLQSVVCRLKHLKTRLDIEDLCMKIMNSDVLGPCSNDNFKSPVVVRVDNDGMWGSGVVVAIRINGGLSEVLIATCQHVIRRNGGTVKVTFEGSKRRYSARVIFAAEENSAFDLAILSLHTDKQVTELLFNQAVLKGDKDHFIVKYCEKTSDFKKGSLVFAKGYPLFDVESSLGPSVSRGVLSNVVIHHGSPVLLHTTCLVHKGSSGGGLFCSQNRHFKGIIVNHVRDDESRTTYPDVNFIIPSNTFMPAIENYVTHNDMSALHSLNCFDEEVMRMWNMEPQKIGSKL